MEILLADIRFGLRTIFNRPVFAIVAILTLALGIGANTAIFSVVNAVLLTPLPYDEPDELVILWGKSHISNLDQQPASLPDFIDCRDSSQLFDRIAATRTQGFNLTDAGEPERVSGARISAGLLSLLGVEPILGRDFVNKEAEPGGEPVILLGHSLWQQRYGSDPSMIGRALNVDGKSYTVVGILPRGFYYPAPDTALYVPLVPQASELIRGNRFLRVTGRLKPGVSLAEARAEMDTLAGRLSEQYPDTNSGWGIEVVPLREQVVGRIRPALMVLLGAVGCVLLIACANVANLLLARAARRRSEFAIRAALGASRGRLIRQLLTESILLSMTGGAVGLLLAIWGVPTLTGISAANIPRVEEIGISGKVLVFTLLVSLVTGAVFGIAPAIQSSNRRLTDDLKDGRRGSTGGVLHQRLLASIVVSEIALALVLLVGAGLMIRSFISINNVPPGFNPSGVLTMGISLSASRYSDIQQQAVFYERLLAEMNLLPGVESAASISKLPLGGASAWTSFTIKGKPVQAGSAPNADYRAVSPGYFKAMGIPLLGGRDLSERDAKDAPDVIVINQMMAEHFFPDEDPLGKRIQIYPEPTRWREVVGVVGNVKLLGLESEINPAIYVPLPQNPYPNAIRNGFLVVRAREPRSLVAAIRSGLRSVDKDVPISQVRTMEEVVSDSLAPRRLNMSLLAVFALLAAVLAAVGIYGVMAYVVTQRTHEIGIRMALGAQQAEVLRMVLGDGAKLTSIGVAIGLGAALGLTRIMSSLLYGVNAADIPTYACISLLLAIIAMLASYLPARRAARVDPIEALRAN
jgi:putative ABC transport system permease protein